MQKTGSFPNRLPRKICACSQTGASLLTAQYNAFVTVTPAKLDIASPTSVKAFAASIVRSEHGSINALINYAGICVDNSPSFSFKQGKDVIDVNHHGTTNMCLTFLPLMACISRIVNISSDSAELCRYSTTLTSRTRNPEITIPELDQLAEEDLEKDRSGDINGKTDGDWKYATAYEVSKALEEGLTVVLARDGKDHGLSINAVHPG